MGSLCVSMVWNGGVWVPFLSPWFWACFSFVLNALSIVGVGHGFTLLFNEVSMVGHAFHLFFNCLFPFVFNCFPLHGGVCGFPLFYSKVFDGRVGRCSLVCSRMFNCGVCFPFVFHGFEPLTNLFSELVAVLLLYSGNSGLLRRGHCDITPV